MTSRQRRFALQATVFTMAALSLAGCNTLQRLSEVGEPPKVSGIEDPTRKSGYQPVSLPMPNPTQPAAGVNSLWRPGARAFFKDQRANEIGDILTVAVSMTDSASMSNITKAASSNSESSAPFGLLGLENSVNKVLPNSVSATSLWNFGSTSGVNGTGSVNRSETVTINMAAVITQKLPNGNLVISGKQELRVNSELRELSVTGVIRPEDISSSNTVSSEKIAEARISYGGRGTVSDVQQPRWGQQLFDAISPF